MDTGHIHSLAEQIYQAGLDEAAEVLAKFLAEQRKAQADDDGISDASQHYIDGAEDALCTLIQHGAADPRQNDVCGCTRNPLGHTRAEHPS